MDKPVRLTVDNQVTLCLETERDFGLLLRFLRRLAREQLGVELMELLREEYRK